MRNGLRLMLAVALTAGVAACDAGDDEIDIYEGEEAATPSLETPAESGTEAALITAQFQPAEGATEAARISGTARIFPANGLGTTTATGTEPDETQTSATTGEGETGQGFRVEVSINGLSQGEHAWHIHSAACGQEAPVVVAFTPTKDQEGLASALNADQSGRAEAEATVPSDELTLDRLQSGQYSLHVHTQSGVDHGPTVACADLRGQGAATM